MQDRNGTTKQEIKEDNLAAELVDEADSEKDLPDDEIINVNDLLNDEIKLYVLVGTPGFSRVFTAVGGENLTTKGGGVYDFIQQTQRYVGQKIDIAVSGHQLKKFGEFSVDSEYIDPQDIQEFHDVLVDEIGACIKLDDIVGLHDVPAGTRLIIAYDRQTLPVGTLRRGINGKYLEYLSSGVSMEFNHSTRINSDRVTAVYQIVSPKRLEEVHK